MSCLDCENSIEISIHRERERKKERERERERERETFFEIFTLYYHFIMTRNSPIYNIFGKIYPSRLPIRIINF